MTKNDATVATFKSHAEAEAAIKLLPRAEFDLQNFAIDSHGCNEHLLILHGKAEDVIRAREKINHPPSASLEELPPLPDQGNIARWEHSLLP